MTFRVSDRGQMSLPAEVRRRWDMVDGGSVEIADLGDYLLVVPTSGPGLREVLQEAIADAGGYADLARTAAADEPDLR